MMILLGRRRIILKSPHHTVLKDFFYIFPHSKEYSVTKIALATEEIYRHIKEKNPKHIINKENPA